MLEEKFRVLSYSGKIRIYLDVEQREQQPQQGGRAEEEGAAVNAHADETAPASEGNISSGREVRPGGLDVIV